MLGIAGAALFYGDCLLTPAISVLSAVEGLTVATPAFQPMVIPIALGVIVALFSVQHFGTSGIGRWFGPITLIWFIVLAVLGVHQIVQRPEVLMALSPHHALGFAMREKIVAFVALGAITLAITGAEALYADMGHFGARPIRMAWLGLVLPALLLNYYGQGALILSDPTALANPFFNLAPDWALYPLVALATAATVIASQATISGRLLDGQAGGPAGPQPEGPHPAHLGQRVRTGLSAGRQLAADAGRHHPDPGVQVVDRAGLGLRHRRHRHDADHQHARLRARRAQLELGLAAQHPGVRRLHDARPGLLSSNMLKFLDGGWVPLAIAAMIFLCMWTWLTGRAAVARREQEDALPLETLLESINPARVHRPQGTAVYLTASSANAPRSLMHNLKHNEVLHEHVVLLSIEVPETPSYRPKRRSQVTHLGKGVHRVVMHYGFMEQPDVPSDLALLEDKGIPFDPMRTSYFVGRNTYMGASKPLLPRWQQKLFLALSRFSASAGDFFGLPTNRVVELGSRIEI